MVPIFRLTLILQTCSSSNSWHLTDQLNHRRRPEPGTRYIPRSSSPRAPTSKASIFLREYFKNSNFFDSCRIFNPQERAYSFHSNVHNVRTWIDYFLVDAKLLPYTNNVKYHERGAWSEITLSLSLNLDHLNPSEKTWKLDPQLLKETELNKFLKEQIKFFFEMNNLPETSPLILWETLKAYLRGCILFFRRREGKEIGQNWWI